MSLSDAFVLLSRKRRYLSACRCRAFSLLAERAKTWFSATGSFGSATTTLGGGACSRTADAIVPANPNELTSARRTGACHGDPLIGNVTGYLSHGICTDGLTTLRCG